MIGPPLQLRSAAAQQRTSRHWTVARERRAGATAGTGATAGSSNEVALKWLIATLFFPEGLSFFIGDFRLSVARVLLIIFTIRATAQYFQKLPNAVFVPSDLLAAAAGLWMVIAPTAMQGPADGLKGGGIMALEFTGTYWIFRQLLGPMDSSVRVVTFAIRLLFLIVALAVLDPLTGKLFTYESVKAITGYAIPGYEWAKAEFADTMYRNGIVRAMGPLEHSILFGSVCAWLGTLAICTFPSRFIGWSAAGTALLGILASQARGPLLAYALSLLLVAFYYATSRFHARWKILGGFFLLGIICLFLLSSNPLATLVNFSAIDPATRWYRQAIWEAVVPMLLDQSPIFGLGLGVDWNWQAYGLAGESVDALWLRLAMILGMPGSFLVLFTMMGAYLNGPLDRSQYLSCEERRLSVGLGIVTVAAIFLGFTVHFWGTCWVLLGLFAGMRANLNEARVRRQKAAQVLI